MIVLLQKRYKFNLIIQKYLWYVFIVFCNLCITYGVIRCPTFMRRSNYIRYWSACSWFCGCFCYGGGGCSFAFCGGRSGRTLKHKIKI